MLKRPRVLRPVITNGRSAIGRAMARALTDRYRCFMSP